MSTTVRWLTSLQAAAGLGLALGLAAPAAAQGVKPGLGLDPELLTLSARFEPATASPGDTAELVLEVTTALGWHAYGSSETVNIPVALSHDKIQFAGLEAVGDAQIPPGKKKEAFGLTQYPLPEFFEVKQTVKVPAGMAAGDVKVAGMFDYQICNESGCRPPEEKPFSATLTVAAAAAKSGSGGEAAGGQEPMGQDPGAGFDPGFKPGLGLDSEDATVLARFDPETARPGETIQLILEVTTPFGWHAYGSNEEVNVPVALFHDKVQFAGLEPVGEADVPPGERKEAHGLVQYPLPEFFEVKQAVKVPDGMATGEVALAGMLNYQICDENGCKPEAEAPFAAKLVVEAGDVRSEYSGAAVAQGGGGESEGVVPAGGGGEGGEGESNGPAKKKGAFDSIWALILACIGGGLFALAMPCTYPMIPITFSFFTKQAEKRGGKVLPLALTYGAGIITIFVVVGVLAAQVIGPIVNHWATNAVIGVFFIVFAFALFGWINLQPPQFLQNVGGKASRTGGLVGVFFMGAVLVITSFTCTAPIVGTLLASVAHQGSLQVGFGMAIFGLTMAIPFVALALLPTKVKAMPKSGEWMDTLKVSLGFVELAAALKFISMVDIALGWQVLNRELYLALTATILFIWVAFLFGFLPKKGQPYEGVSGARQGTGILVSLLAVYLLMGSNGQRLDLITTSFIPAYHGAYIGPQFEGGGGGGDGEAKQSKGHTIVKDDPAGALQVAKTEDKLLLYNFTGFN